MRHLNDIINFLVLCRPLSVSMGNAIRHLKMQITKVPPTMPDSEAKDLLIEVSQSVIHTLTQAHKHTRSAVPCEHATHGQPIVLHLYQFAERHKRNIIVPEHVRVCDATAAASQCLWFARYSFAHANISTDIRGTFAYVCTPQEIENYIVMRIENADRQLIKLAMSKVENGDVILTYAASYCVQASLEAAAAAGKKFKVVVMDCRPEYEGRITLQKLLAAGIPCTYVHLNAASYIIKEVTKVFLGAAAVLSNGTVLSRAGTAAVAMMAHAHSVPVMICCETHKFNERVQLDSITHNELGDPEALASVPGRTEVQNLQVGTGCWGSSSYYFTLFWG